MRRLLFVLLLICFITIAYFFIKEQFNKVVLTSGENLVLSITYLLVGIILLILFIVKNREDRKRSG
ncbi:hypothetical protein EFY79_12425 [Hanamia caeni]|jgi:hypothetical protein|uniref:Uncharacterized protein n=1 Tax=Hanamia caeni TaxID=2294116 RepID=A0A3M9NFK2_9BACT|nr:hypothetical protein [Hanamia caeni]RNI35758.1 hypothetical protein EFY79_12425 [Hanamia caeni]